MEKNASGVTYEHQFGYVKDGQVYLKASSPSQEDRKIGVVKTTDVEAIAYFIGRFNFISSKVEALLSDISNAQNKGSFMMKLLHLKGQLSSYDALGDFQPLIQKLEQEEANIKDLIHNNRKKNLEIKQALLAEWKEHVPSGEITEWSVVLPKARELKDKWLKTGAVEPELEAQIEGEYESLIADFHEKRRIYFEERQRIISERVAKYNVIVEKARQLKSPDKPAFMAFREFGQMHEAWKSVGPIPKTFFEPLIREMKEIKKDILRNLKKQKRRPPSRPNSGGSSSGGYSGNRFSAPPPPLSSFDPVLVENMKKKEEVIKQVASYEKMDLREAYSKTKELQAKWKDLGNVPDPFVKDINSKFTYVCDRIFELSYLMRTVYLQNRFFNSKPENEKLKIMIGILANIIRKDEEELKIMQKEFDAIPEAEKRLPVNKPLYGKVQTQGRKLRVKNTLLSEFNKKLETL